MLTFRALRRNHIVSTAFETIAKKKRRDNTTEVGREMRQILALVRWLFRGEKRDLTSMTVPEKNDICNRTQIHTAGDLSPLRF